jgi:hypothetical protein
MLDIHVQFRLTWEKLQVDFNLALLGHFVKIEIQNLTYSTVIDPEEPHTISNLSTS